MLNLKEEFILQKLIDIRELDNTIGKIIDNNYLFSTIGFNRLHRGEVHSLVADQLNLVLNNDLCVQIRDKIIQKGGLPYTSKGRLYYKHVIAKG